MGEPRIQLKVNFTHDAKEDKNITRTERELLKMINHPNQRVEAVRIASGYRASGVFFELASNKWWVDALETKNHDISLLLLTIEDVLEREYDNVNINRNNWYLRPIEKGETASKHSGLTAEEV